MPPAKVPQSVGLPSWLSSWADDTFVMTWVIPSPSTTIEVLMGGVGWAGGQGDGDSPTFPQPPTLDPHTVSGGRMGRPTPPSYGWEIVTWAKSHGLLEAERNLMTSLVLLSLHHIPGSVLYWAEKATRTQLSLLRVSPCACGWKTRKKRGREKKQMNVRSLSLKQLPSLPATPHHNYMTYSQFKKKKS